MPNFTIHIKNHIDWHQDVSENASPNETKDLQKWRKHNVLERIDCKNSINCCHSTKMNFVGVCQSTYCTKTQQNVVNVITSHVKKTKSKLIPIIPGSLTISITAKAMISFMISHGM